MNPLARLKFWVFENRFHKKAVRFQHQQVEEHREILREIRQGRRAILHETADIVLRLQAVTDALEETLEGTDD